MLYESYIHPITILSTIPSAGVGALLALLLTHNELNVIGTIGIILLIGLVKKNAIMMIDVALDVERTQGKKPVEAIYEACILRFRPIMMTTMAALLGGLPLALGSGTGSELHRPLGITIVGGLIVSQMLTLFTTPVVYVYLDRLRLALRGGRGERAAGAFIPWRCHSQSGALALTFCADAISPISINHSFPSSRHRCKERRGCNLNAEFLHRSSLQERACCAKDGLSRMIEVQQ